MIAFPFAVLLSLPAHFPRRPKRNRADEITSGYITGFLAPALRFRGLSWSSGRCGKVRPHRRSDPDILHQRKRARDENCHEEVPLQ